MKLLLRKLKNFGFRRVIVLVLIRFINTFRIIFYRYLLSDSSPSLINSRIIQPTHFVGRGVIDLNNVQVGVWPSPELFSGSGYIEARTCESKVNIGSGSFINNSCVIIADRTSITIGERCLIGPRFFVTDSDFHGLSIENRLNGEYDCSPVRIGDDVFIGAGVKILKGVSIGTGAVIGSGSVVVKDVENLTVYAGVPAKKIGCVNQ